MMSAPIETGQTFAHYRLLERIGAGGMGEVFVGFDTRVQKRVAIKFLTAPSQRRDLFERFQNEARLHARLFHPNVARLFGFVADARPPYLVMELIEGPTLKEWMKQARTVGWHERLRVFAAIADGVGYLHANGIVHRDLKPGNVRLTRDGRPKLLDFGIAKDAQTPNLTMAGNVVGTLQFLAPEQLEGAPADARSDVWALGILLYELLTGRLPFASDNISDLMTQVRKCRFPPATSIDTSLPPALDRLVQSCLRPDPDDRPQDGAALAAAVRALGAGGQSSMAPGEKRSLPPDVAKGRAVAPGPANHSHRRPRRGWMVLAGAGGLVVAGIGVLAVVSESEIAPLASTTCDQAGSADSLFPVNIQGNGGTFEVWANGTKCGSAGAEGVWFQAVAGTKLSYECRTPPHGVVSRHEITVGATNIYSCP